MSKQFTIVGEEYVGYRQGNAYIISNGECKFSLWESKEDAQKVCDYLNEQQATIQFLQDKIDELKDIDIYEYEEKKHSETARKLYEENERLRQLYEVLEMLDIRNKRLRAENKQLHYQIIDLQDKLGMSEKVIDDE